MVIRDSTLVRVIGGCCCSKGPVRYKDYVVGV